MLYHFLWSTSELVSTFARFKDPAGDGYQVSVTFIPSPDGDYGTGVMGNGYAYLCWVARLYFSRPLLGLFLLAGDHYYPVPLLLTVRRGLSTAAH